MSQLIIDIGNSNARIAGVDTQQFAQVEVVAADQLIAHLQQRSPAPEQIVFSSVGNKAVSQQLLSQFPQSRQITTPAYAHGVINAYRQYAKLGVDRWLAMVGLRQSYFGPAVIVDVGTAVTVDLLDEFGQHRGGWIVPGMEMMVNALTAGTAQVASDQPLGDIGFATQTASCVSNGCLAAVHGLVEQARQQAMQTLGSSITPLLVLTGGQGELVSQLLPLEHRLDPMLVLKGLACYARKRG